MRKNAAFFSLPPMLAQLTQFCAVLPIALYASSAIAESTQSPRGFEMEEVVVTGVRDETLWRLPNSVAVITADDIEHSASNSIAELLSKEANVNLLSFFGSDKFANVDIRGMGETSVSNVVVMIDGVKVNTADLSGPDLSGISLGQIERIEVIRGGGSVRYGDGAVGGVVNIITRNTRAAPYVRGKVGYGSYNTNKAEFEAGAGMHGLEVAGSAAVYDSNGYRDNGFLHQKDGAFTIRFNRYDWVNWYARAAIHDDRNGFPGPVTRADFRFSDDRRRATRSPSDEGSTTDRRFRSGVKLEFNEFGSFDFSARYRNRENPFLIGFSPLLRVADQDQKIAEQSRVYNATYALPVKVGTYEHHLAVGYTQNSADYSRRFGGRGVLDVSGANQGRLNGHAHWAHAQFALPANFVFSLGYRSDEFKIKRRTERLIEACDTEIVDTTVFIDTPFGPLPIVIPLPITTNCRGELSVALGQDDRWTSDALEVGLVFSPYDALNLFFNYSRSFRNPNVDELTLASSNLGPQTGEHWDFGLRTRFGRKFEGSLSFFQFEIEDEIFFGFDVVSGERVNTNFEDVTRRRGFEIELKYRPFEQLLLWTNIGYVQARFLDSGTTVPLVPSVTANLGARYSPTQHFTVSLAASHSGSRFDGDDLANDAFEKLPSYETVDMKFVYGLGAWKFDFSVNNLFDETYATQGFSGTVFPMPGRNVLASVGFEF